MALPEPDEAACRRYYAQNRRRFRSPDIYEAAHILIAADARDPESYGKAREKAQTLLDEARREPARFGALARLHSDCPSGAQDGNLGQISSGQTTPEFEAALVALAPGDVSAEPVATRYGFHIVRLDRRVAGQTLPFEAVAGRIADYLAESVARRATAQYIARLAARATITGIEMPASEALWVS